MNFVELESVLAVYYYRSFKEASRQTATSLSAVSKHVSRVEQELGVKLYERGTKATQISLTSAGVRILPLIAQSMVSYRRIIKEAERCRGAEERVIKIGYLPLIGTVGENDIVADFYEQHPSKEIDLTGGYSKDLLELVTVGDLDGTFILSVNDAQEPVTDWSEHDSKLRFIPTTTNTRFYVGMSERHPLASRTSIDLHQLKGERFVFSPTQRTNANQNPLSSRPMQVSCTEELVGVGPGELDSVFMDFKQKAAVLRFVADGQGVLPCINYEGEKIDGVRFVPAEHWDRVARGAFVYRADNHSRTLSNFIDCVRAFSRRYLKKTGRSRA